VIDLFTRECLAIDIGQGLGGQDVAAALERLRFERGLPQRIYCDNGTEFISAAMDLWGTPTASSSNRRCSPVIAGPKKAGRSIPPVWRVQRGNMSDDKTRSEVNRVKAEEGREDAEDLREEADQERDSAEGHRALAEAARKEAEQFRVLAEEARALREQYREELESVRHEREGLRHAAEEARKAAEEARHATIAAVAATADALSANLAQMQFLEDARNTLRQLKGTKPGDVH
jgi:flagellar biosynthesis GTPase FlhF